MHNLRILLQRRSAAVNTWLTRYESSTELPLYSSVDIRDAGFKSAVVDTNLFPAGFNNLCEHGVADSIVAVRQVISERIAGCRNVLVIAEEHTRNAWYLEHLRVLQHIIATAGFTVRTATFLDIKPAVCSEANFVELETATGQPMRIYSINRVLKDVCAGGMRPCFVILNNDLTGGIPDVLRDLDVPIYPSMQAGWHARSKAHHFTHLQDVTRELADILSVDPWVLSTLTDTVDAVDIRDVHDRQRVADTAADVMRRVQVKYTEHGIGEKPFVFVKADSGTYGMGVMPIEDPQELLELNNRQRNKLHKGKGAQTIDRFLLQEGVPSVHTVDGCVSEVCIYQITHQFVGGFYRLHTDKSARENLNSKGMAFKTMCPHLSCFGSNTVPEHPGAFDVYRLLARVAGIAAHHEIQHLEAARL